MSDPYHIPLDHQRFHALSLNAILCCSNLMNYQACIPVTIALVRVHFAAFSAAFGSPVTPTTDENVALRRFVLQQWMPMQLRPLLRLDRLAWGHRGPSPKIWAEITATVDTYDAFHAAIRKASADFAEEASAATCLLAVG